MAHICSKIGVLERLIHRYPLLGIEGQSFGEEVNRVRRGLGEERRKRAAFADGQSADVVSGATGRNRIELF